MFGQNEAEQNLRNYSQQSEFMGDWMQKYKPSKISLQKVRSTEKIGLFSISDRQKSTQNNWINPKSSRNKHASQKEESKKSSLPQISFPLLGGTSKQLQQSQLSKLSAKMMITRFGNCQNQTDRNFHNKLIHRVVQRQTFKLRESENYDKYATKQSNFLSRNFQFKHEYQEGYKNFKSLRKTIKPRKTDAKINSYHQKLSLKVLQKNAYEKISLGDLFQKLE